MLQKILYNFEIALESIQQNKLRSFLTSLGIIFGVGSVIAMLAIGRGAQDEVLKQMELLGTNNVIIQPVMEQSEGEVTEDNAKNIEQKRFSPGLTLDDMESIRELIPEITFVSPEIVYETNFIRSGRLRTGKLVGVNKHYFDINNFTFYKGTSFSDVHFQNAEPVCVIGYDISTRFFAGDNPIGKRIKTGGLWLTVVGVLQQREISTKSIENLGIRNYNLDIYSPAQTLLLRFKNRAMVTKQDVDAAEANSNEGGGGMVIIGGGGSTGNESPTNKNYHQIDRLIVQLEDNSYSVIVADIIRRMLVRRHNDVIDFEVIVPELLLQQEQRTKQIFNLVLSSIASISLIVGGIGIMNIMLASVVERYREIGVRRAVGAQKKDIQLQFLTEALTLSITGGVAGTIIGILAAYLIEITADIATIVTLSSIVISFGVAMLIGVVFGYVPAKRAAEQDPVNALRHE